MISESFITQGLSTPSTILPLSGLGHWPIKNIDEAEPTKMLLIPLKSLDSVVSLIVGGGSKSYFKEKDPLTKGIC